jgi:hypothetical protein
VKGVVVIIPQLKHSEQIKKVPKQILGPVLCTAKKITLPQRLYCKVINTISNRNILKTVVIGRHKEIDLFHSMVQFMF